jgi:hypothetical protein
VPNEVYFDTFELLTAIRDPNKRKPALPFRRL